MEPLLVRATRREPVERTPVWFMRQAGRSLPEYRRLREGRTLFDVVADPELTAEVTLQPVRRYDVDAAVMFADIMYPVLGMGVDVKLVENLGPVIEHPIRRAADVDRLRVPDPDSTVTPILEAVRIVRGELRDDQAVIGFCGGPFTVAGYLVEGKPRAKARAGADVIQLFDSWVGALSLDDYAEFVAPYSEQILGVLDVPTIHFGTGTTHLLGAMAEAGGDVVGVDWRVPLDRAWELVGDEKGVQGNLDPAALLAPWERIEAETRTVLERVGGRPGHIFNLGHGVLPDTDPAVLGRLRELVHELTTEVRV
jgi:uroporphyrinogen decarboxylase